MKQKQRAFALALECAALIGMLSVASWYGFGHASPGSVRLMPSPDSPEQAWLASSMLHGFDPRLKIGNQLRPSRYSPAHPFFLQLAARWQRGMAGIHQWSPVGICMGLLAVWLWLWLGGLDALARLGAVGMILFTPLFFRMSQTIMQESTIFMLFGLTMLGWLAWLRMLEQPDKPRWRLHVLGTAIGVVLGLLIAIRGTYIVLAPCMAGTHLYFRQGEWRALAATATACAAVFAAQLTWNGYTGAGFGLFSYAHWGHYFTNSFLWRQLWQPPFVSDAMGEPHPAALMMLRDWFGFQPEATAFGPLAMIPLALLGLWALIERVRDKDWPQPDIAPESWMATLLPAPDKRLYEQMVALALFLITQFALHHFYFFYSWRFWILAYPCIVLLGMAGWSLALKRALQRDAGNIRRKLAITALAALPLMVALHAKPVYRSVRNHRPNETEILHAEQNNAELRRLGAIVAATDYPLFVYGRDLVAYRVLMGLERHPRVVAPMIEPVDKNINMYCDLILHQSMAPPAGWLEDRSLWPDQPYACFLYDVKRQSVQTAFLGKLLDRYGSLFLLADREQESRVAPLLEFLRQSGLDVRENPTAKHHRFLKISRQQQGSEE
ncbi:hypothetical protein JXA32_03085 [Candidatus Sumerlaeota bacterium]|nr:hypothetical protein [Candidatus Sumerlaeota bacterium]